MSLNHLYVDDTRVGTQQLTQGFSHDLLVGAQLRALGNDGDVCIAQHVAMIMCQAYLHTPHMGGWTVTDIAVVRIPAT